MSHAVRNLRAAREEFAEAVRWYEEHRQGLGADFFDQVTEATTRIQTFPEIGRPVSEDGLTRRLLVARFPYQIVYRLTPDEIVILAVAHRKRRPDYWRHRR